MTTNYLKYPTHRKVDKIETVIKKFNVGDRVVAMVDIADTEFGMPYAKVGDVLRILDIRGSGKINPIVVCHELGVDEINTPLMAPDDLDGKSLKDLAFFVNEREIKKTVSNPFMDRFPLKGDRYVDPSKRK